MADWLVILISDGVQGCGAVSSDHPCISPKREDGANPKTEGDPLVPCFRLVQEIPKGRVIVQKFVVVF
jgi:hypothetical protein